MQDFLRAFRLGRLLVTGVFAVMAVGYWAFSRVRDVMAYDKVEAVVERVEPVCYLAGEPATAATECLGVEARGRVARKRVVHLYRVNVHYRSPADGQQHAGVILASAKLLKEIPSARPWQILANVNTPGEIKAAD